MSVQCGDSSFRALSAGFGGSGLSRFVGVEWSGVLDSESRRGRGKRNVPAMKKGAIGRAGPVSVLFGGGWSPMG